MQASLSPEAAPEGSVRVALCGVRKAGTKVERAEDGALSPLGKTVNLLNSLHLSQLVIPNEAEDLASSGVYAIDREDFELFVQLPKVCWVAIYKLLDTSSLFRAQRVCKQWRNLINQPIIWVDRAREEEMWVKKHEERLPTGFRSWRVKVPDTAELINDDPTEIYGPENVAEMKRLCKAAFIKRAVLEQPFNPKSEKVAALLDQASTAERESQLDFWEEALVEEECGQIYFDRARHYETSEMFDESIRDYQAAVRLCPYDHNIRTRLGLTYHKRNELQQALRNYLKTAALCPWYQLAWNNAGSIFFNTGLYDRAEKCFSRCITLDSNASIAFNNRGLCRFLAGDGPKAVEDFTTAYELNQQDRTARANRAAAYILAGDYQAALDDCMGELTRVARTSDGASLPYLHKHMGHAYKMLGQPEKAISALRETIAAMPDYRQAYDLLASCLVDLGQLQEARDVAEAATAYEEIHGNNQTIFAYYLR